MKPLRLILLLLVSAVSAGLHAGVAYPEPPGGWSYLYEGNDLMAGADGSGFTSLDGTWSHDNGSDAWDGSEIGGTFGAGNGPGGVNKITEGDVTYLRIQDTGDPRDFAMPDPSNRKIYFGHDMSTRGASGTVLDDGVTLTFRARIPTSGALDPLHRDGSTATMPYPAEGDGYVTSDGGKGNFVIKQSSGGAIAFSLTQINDTTGGGLTPTANFAGLTMNEFAGNTISGNVNFGQGSATNVVAFDPTEWHEFWIVLRKDPANEGTHQAFIYRDGSLTPTVFRITAGTGSDYDGISYLAIGMTATPQNAALDVDFVGYKVGAHFPPGFAEPPGGWDYRYDGNQLMVGADGSGFTSLDGTWSHDNGSDAWDGSEIGGTFGTGNGPGGVSMITEGGLTYVRIQDTGDPRDFAMPDPSNRKIYFGHDMTGRGATTTQMDDGVTLAFRARIPTSGPLDPLHRDGSTATMPYPPEGDGYVTSDGGKGNFVIKQSSGGAIAFSLTQTNDTTGGGLTPTANFAGLTMNEFAGNAISANVNFGQGTGTNVVAFNPTEWHTIWITLREDPANIGTHQAYVYLDGSLEPIVFKMTAGTGSDYDGITYLAMGMTATPQNAALDVDWVAYKLGAHFPGGALDNLPPEVLEIIPANGTTYYDASAGISFKATTVGNNSLLPEGFKLTLNGADVSSGLNVTGPEQDRTVTYLGLEPNVVYAGELIVSDQAGRSTTNELQFDTFTSSILSVEAEEYNYDGGQYLMTDSIYSYSGFVGTPGVDFSDTMSAPGTTFADHYYRYSDPVGTPESGDIDRQIYVDWALSELEISLLQGGEWLNYTRDFSAGSFRVYLRQASTANRTVRLERVTSDRTAPNQSTVLLGTFTTDRTGSLTTFGYTPLLDAEGNQVVLRLSGTETVRLRMVDANNDLRLNYIAFAPATAITDPQVVASPGEGNVIFPDAPIEVTVLDGGSPVAPGSITLRLDGNDVTGAATVTDFAGGVNFRYQSPDILAAGSTHTLEVVVGGGTHEWDFSVANLPTIPASYSTPPGSGRTPGFNIKIRKAPNTADAGLFPNSITRAEAHLADLIIDPLTSQPFLNEAAGANNDGTYQETGVINYEQNAGASGLFGGKTRFPNIATADPDYISMEATAYLELEQGVHRFVVASDDAFRVTTGPSFTEQPLILGEWNADRGIAATSFDFVVESDGVYAFRLLYTEGGGGAAVEWYSIDRASGEAILINDSTNPNAVDAYQDREGGPAPSGVTITSISTDGGITFSFMTESGRSYRIESAPSIPAAAWTEEQTIQGDGTLKSFTQAAGGTQKYYRVAIP